ncbi:MAG: hypothetical protein JWQ96_2287 [Segetibacter sp.]|nr:hypothetical protein [Segetibacter sp.]
MRNAFKILLLALSIFTSSRSYSQYYYYDNNYYEKDLLFEVGAGVGGMNCITDLGGSKTKGGLYINDVNWKNTQVAGTFYVGAMYRQTFGVRIEATFGSVNAHDSILKGASDEQAKGRYGRNLGFRSNITEIAVLAEVHPLMFFNLEEPLKFSPYITAGLGYFSFNPQANINGYYVDLQPLRTEGQGFREHPGRWPYHRSQANVPIGAGIKYELSSLLNLRFEFLHRILFTDYLDDVSTTYIDPALFDKYLTGVQAGLAKSLYRSNGGTPVVGGQRGGPNSNDTYMSFSLKVGLILGRERR